MCLINQGCVSSKSIIAFYEFQKTFLCVSRLLYFLWELKNRGLTIFVFQSHELPNLKVHKNNQIEVHVCISRFTLQFCKILDQLQLLFFSIRQNTTFFSHLKNSDSFWFQYFIHFERFSDFMIFLTKPRMSILWKLGM